MNTNTYTQSEKNESRKLLWNHTITSLTSNAESKRLLDTECIREIATKANEYIPEERRINSGKLSDRLNEWSSVLERWKYKKKSEIKIAFFCGPDPINDLQILIENNIEIHNIWMFEIDKKTSQQAQSNCNLASLFPNFYFGSIDDFSNSQPDKFDIVYLDFTKSLLSTDKMPLKTIERMFFRQMLTDNSFLIVNSCYPDKTTESIEFLSNYIYKRQWVNIKIEEESGIKENLTAYGIDSIEQCKALVENDFENVYSEFSTSIVANIGAVWAPTYRLTNNRSFRKFFYSEQAKLLEISKISIQEQEKGEINLELVREGKSILQDIVLCADEYPDWYFLDFISNAQSYSSFKTNFCNRIDGNEFTYFDSIKMFYVLNNIEEGNYYYASPELIQFLKNFVRSTIEIKLFQERGGLFCDVPMSSQWVANIYGKYGHPYHINPSYCQRYSYTAKTRKMCLDVLSFEKCRELYDWVPSHHFFTNKYDKMEDQLIIRSCCDRIYKAGFYTVQSLFKYNHLVYSGDCKNNYEQKMPERIPIA